MSVMRGFMPMARLTLAPRLRQILDRVLHVVADDGAQRIDLLLGCQRFPRVGGVLAAGSGNEPGPGDPVGCEYFVRAQVDERRGHVRVRREEADPLLAALGVDGTLHAVDV